MERDFVNRQRYERTRHGDGEPLRPTFQQPEANSLRQEETCIKEAANPETPDGIRSKSDRVLNGPIDIPAARVQAKHLDPMCEHARDVAVEQMYSAQANRDKKNCF